jgi:hypothetical protein
MIIALCGKSGAGKDTAGDYLADKYGFQHEALAWPLKDACAILFNLDDAQLYGDMKNVMDARWGITPRRIMQFVGTEMFRHKLKELIPNIGEDFWVDALHARLNKTHNYVITDIRFNNEITYLADCGVHKIVVIKIDRDVTQDNHISEKCEISPDHAVNNNGSFDDLYHELDHVMSIIGVPKLIYTSKEGASNNTFAWLLLTVSIFVAICSFITT